MRKKLFAVIMSAMMMITFMPAMAFANTLDDPTQPATKAGFYVSGLTTTAAEHRSCTYNVDAFKEFKADFTYDGKDHTVTFATGTASHATGCGMYWPASQHATVTEYTMTYNNTNWDSKYFPKATPSKEAPVVKNAGYYIITAKVQWKEDAGYLTDNTYTLYLRIDQRIVKVTGINQIVKTKDYDGKPVELGADELTVEAFKDVNGKELYNSGLIAGESLFTGTVKTGVDAGTYYYSYDALINQNYKVEDAQGRPAWNNVQTERRNHFVTVVINKANNVVTAPVTHRAAKAGSKFSINAKAKFGDVKVTKVQGSKYLKVSGKKILVKANAKKGSYKIKVKVYSEGNTNYKAASLTKWVYVNVR